MVAAARSKMNSFTLPTDPSTAKDYATWRKDAMIWTKLTDLPSNKHGLALQYVCKSDVTVHEIIANINSCEIESNEGFQTVLKTLDEIFNYSESNEEIKAYDNFQLIKRENGEAVSDFIVKFDFLVNKLQKYGNTFNENQLADKLIKANNLTATQIEIVKAFTPNMNYASVKATLKRVYPDVTEVSHTSDTISPCSTSKPYPYPHTTILNVRDGHQSSFHDNLIARIDNDKNGKFLNNENNMNVISQNKVSNRGSPICGQKLNLSNYKYRNINLVKNSNKSHTYDKTQEKTFLFKDMPNCTTFNELLVMDIKPYNGVYLLSMLDMFSYYSVTVVLNIKESQEVFHNFSKYWLEIFGPPLKVVTSNFNCDLIFNELKTAVECKSIIFSFIPSKSTWCNHICEENHQVIIDSVEKILSHRKYPLTVAVLWAVNFKNCTENAMGFSPSRLVFGFNLLLPAVNSFKPPYFSHDSYINIIFEHLEAKKSARKSWVRAEMSKLFRRNLDVEHSENGIKNSVPAEKVFYRRLQDTDWRQPATLIKEDNELDLLNGESKWVQDYDISKQEIHRCTDRNVESKTPVGKKLSPSIENIEKNTNENNSGGLYWHFFGVMFGGHAVNGLKVPK